MLRHVANLAAVLMVLCSRAHAVEPYVTGTYEPLAQGYLVQFSLHNPIPDEVLTAWSVWTADATDPAAPTGWRINQDFRQVEWVALTPADQVQPLQSLGGFGYQAENPPGTLDWWVGSNRWSYVGTVTPELIPEPSSLLVLGCGLAAVGLPRLRRRRGV